MEDNLNLLAPASPELGTAQPQLVDITINTYLLPKQIFPSYNILPINGFVAIHFCFLLFNLTFIHTPGAAHCTFSAYLLYWVKMIFNKRVLDNFHRVWINNLQGEKCIGRGIQIFKIIIATYFAIILSCVT